MEIGRALMVSDILIVLGAAWQFGIGTGLYCILGLILTAVGIVLFKTPNSATQKSPASCAKQGRPATPSNLSLIHISPPAGPEV